MRASKGILIGLVAFSLTGCGNSINRLQEISWLELTGTLGGALIGGFAGSQLGGGFGQIFYMTSGVLVGGSSGYSVFRNLGTSDQAYYKSTVHHALTKATDGEIIRWNNPKTGRKGIFRPINTYYRPNGQMCRQYRASVIFDDGVYSNGGIACLIANGSWFKSLDEFG